MLSIQMIKVKKQQIAAARFGARYSVGLVSNICRWMLAVEPCHIPGRGFEPADSNSIMDSSPKNISESESAKLRRNWECADKEPSSPRLPREEDASHRVPKVHVTLCREIFPRAMQHPGLGQYRLYVSEWMLAVVRRGLGNRVRGEMSVCQDGRLSRKAIKSPSCNSG